MNNTSISTSDFSTIVFAKPTIACISLTTILLLAMPFVFWLAWRQRNKGRTSFKYLFAGAACFLIFARVFELAVHIFCIVLDNPVSRFINGNDLAYIIYGIVMAGVFEECGRYIILRYFMKRNRTPENAVLFGIGHGGIEVLTVVLPTYILYFVIAIMFSRGNITDALSVLNINEQTASAAFPVVQSASEIGISDCLLIFLERLMCMFVHIGLTVIVFYSIIKEKPNFLFIAIALHMAVDVLAAMLQRGMVSVPVCEAWIFAWTVVVFVIAKVLYKKSGIEQKTVE